MTMGVKRCLFALSELYIYLLHISVYSQGEKAISVSVGSQKKTILKQNKTALRKEWHQREKKKKDKPLQKLGTAGPFLFFLHC